MTFDIPHMTATAAIIFAILWLVDHTQTFENATTRRKSLVKSGGIFIVILNIVWPYGSGV